MTPKRVVFDEAGRGFWMVLHKGRILRWWLGVWQDVTDRMPADVSRRLRKELR